MKINIYTYCGARQSKDDCSGLSTNSLNGTKYLTEDDCYYNMFHSKYLDHNDYPIIGKMIVDFRNAQVLYLMEH